MACANWLHSPGSGIPGRVAGFIDNFLHPILPKRAENNTAKIREARLVELCTSAYDLTILLRRCRDIYQCQIPDSATPFNPEEAEQQDTEKWDGKGPSGVRIAVVLSGILVKYPEDNPKRRIVLEKAWVVTRG